MKSPIAILLLFFFSGPFYGQQNNGNTRIDSILRLIPQIKEDSSRVNEFIQIAKEYKVVNPETGIVYGKKALQLSRAIKWNDGIAGSLLIIGVNNYNLGELDTAMAQYAEVLKQTKNKAIIGETYKWIGAIYIAKSDYTKALEYNFKSLKIGEKIQNKILTADACHSIGVIYAYMENTEKALLYLNKALAINTKLNRRSAIRVNLRIIGSQYLFVHKYEIAMSYFLKALKIAKETGDKETIAGVDFDIAQMHLEQKQVEKAIPYAVECRKISTEIKNSRLICASELLEANAYVMQLTTSKTIDKELLLKAETLIKDAIEIAQKTNNTLVRSQCYKTLSEIYSLQNEHKIAKETYILYTNLQDSIYSEESKETVENMENQRTIELKNKEIQYNRLKLESNRKLQWLYIFVIGLFAVIGLLLLLQNRNRRRTNEKLQLLNDELDLANKIKARFFGILNHDLKSPVSSLISFLYIRKESADAVDLQTLQQMEDKTIQSAENLLESMEDILLWGKAHMDNFEPHPKPVNIAWVFDDLGKHFQGVANTTFVFDAAQNHSIHTDEDFLKTILRNIISNAVRALNQTSDARISVKSWRENDQDFLSVTDNGPGAAHEKLRALYDEKEVVGIQSGLGLHLIRDLAKAIGCQIDVDSDPDGTRFLLIFQ